MIDEIILLSLFVLIFLSIVLVIRLNEVIAVLNKNSRAVDYLIYRDNDQGSVIFFDESNDENVILCIKNNDIKKAVDVYRKRYGTGLKKASDAVEKIRENIRSCQQE